MNKKQRITNGEPRIRLVAPTAALASGLLSTAAWSAPGDLDPTFGDVGRSIGWPGTTGDALGAATDCRTTTCCSPAVERTTRTASRPLSGPLDGDGSLDRLLTEALLGQAVVYDFALQPDGKVVLPVVRAGHGVGRTASSSACCRTAPSTSRSAPTAWCRFTGSDVRDGSGTNRWSSTQDGRIAVAGRRGSGTAVVRLLPNGAPDTSFGAVGRVPWAYACRRSEVAVRGRRRRLPAAGALRPVEPGKPARCRVQALTAGGAGRCRLRRRRACHRPTRFPPGWCYSVAADASGRLVVGGGSDDGNGSTAFLARLLGNGAVDPSFDAGTSPRPCVSVTDLAVAADGRIVVTGQDQAGLSGVLVSRLQADGRLDEVFGRGGTSRVALPAALAGQFLGRTTCSCCVERSDRDRWRRVDVRQRPQPFVARLSGDASRGGPGLLGVEGRRVSRFARPTGVRS